MTRPFGCGISVYPVLADQEEVERAKAYIGAAARLGYGEVFTSLHMPEQDALRGLEALRGLGEYARGCGMDFTADISGARLDRILCDPDLRGQMKRVPLTHLRLDYGYRLEQMEDCVGRLGVRGIVLNASVLEEREVSQEVGALQRLGVEKIKACHNFYPRPETGLSLAFMVRRSLPFRALGIPVTACVASLRHPRGPLGAGLPTVEAHRRLGVEHAAMELLHTGAVDTLLLGDPYASEEELSLLSARCQGAPVRLGFVPAPGISGLERELVFGGVHHARPDAAEGAIRSQTSRQMATPGAAVPARLGGKRCKYAVTIDNEEYQRYSGELQILLKDMPPDPRVNVVGHLAERDRFKADLLLPGGSFMFTQ